MKFAQFLAFPLLCHGYVRREIPQHIAKHIVDPTKVSHTPDHDLDQSHFTEQLERDTHQRKSADQIPRVDEEEFVMEEIHPEELKGYF